MINTINSTQYVVMSITTTEDAVVRLLRAGDPTDLPYYMVTSNRWNLSAEFFDNFADAIETYSAKIESVLTSSIN